MGGFGPNEWLVDELYEQYLRDPNSVDRAWWDFFTDYTPHDPSVPAPAGAATPSAPSAMPAPVEAPAAPTPVSAPVPTPVPTPVPVARAGGPRRDRAPGSSRTP